MCASYRKVTIVVSCVCPFLKTQLDHNYVRTSHSREYHINTQKLTRQPRFRQHAAPLLPPVRRQRSAK